MKKIIGLLVVCLLLTPAAHARMGRTAGSMPSVQLLEPGDNAVIGKDGIVFRWSDEGGNRDYFDFRLYHGPQTVEANLIVKEKVPRDKHGILVEPEMFKVGETYSWSVRQVGAKKSREEYSVFKIKA